MSFLLLLCGVWDFFTFVWFLQWVIKLVFQSIATAFTGLGYLSVCHHLRNTAHENILLKLPKWELQMAQLVLFWWGRNGLHDLFLCEVLSTCMRIKLLVSCWRNWVYNRKKSNGFYFHTDVSVMIENNVKEKLTTVLLSRVVLDDILAPLNWSWGSFLMCKGSKFPAVDCVGEMGCTSRSGLFIRPMFVTNCSIF